MCVINFNAELMMFLCSPYNENGCVYTVFDGIILVFVNSLMTRSEINCCCKTIRNGYFLKF